MSNVLVKQILKELEDEAPATRKCLENIKEGIGDYKPHDKSMKFSGLYIMAADIPRWISTMIRDGEINFATYGEWAPASMAELPAHLDETMDGARKALESLTDEDLSKTFTLKHGDQVLMSLPLGDSLTSTINHWVHHRGQMTVYMRLNDIPVPSIYGPSADQPGF